MTVRKNKQKDFSEKFSHENKSGSKNRVPSSKEIENGTNFVNTTTTENKKMKNIYIYQVKVLNIKKHCLLQFHIHLKKRQILLMNNLKQVLKKRWILKLT